MKRAARANKRERFRLKWLDETATRVERELVTVTSLEEYVNDELKHLSNKYKFVKSLLGKPVQGFPPGKLVYDLETAVLRGTKAVQRVHDELLVGAMDELLKTSPALTLPKNARTAQKVLSASRSTREATSRYTNLGLWPAGLVHLVREDSTDEDSHGLGDEGLR